MRVLLGVVMVILGISVYLRSLSDVPFTPLTHHGIVQYPNCSTQDANN